jgi:acyl carrier protein
LWISTPRQAIIAVHPETEPMSLEKAFADVFNIQTSSVHDELQLRDIASWDSLAHMMLIARLEEDFKVQFNGDEIADMATVGDARRALRRHGAAA